MSVPDYNLLSQEAPDPTHGFEIGFDDWRFVVEMLLPSTPGAVVGYSKVGTAILGSDAVEWVDVTSKVRGLEWTRGAQSYAGRVETGTASVTFVSDDHEFAPWNWSPDSFNSCGFAFRPGLIVRWGCISPTLLALNEPYEPLDLLFPSPWNGWAQVGWLPLFLGLVESWPEESVGVDADSWVMATIVESTAIIAGVDFAELEGPLSYPQEAGDPDGDRLNNLLLGDGLTIPRVFPFNVYLPAGYASVPLVESRMAANRNAECQQTADSAQKVIRGDGLGVRYVPQAGYRWRDAVLPQDWQGDFVANVIEAYYPGQTITLVSSSSADHEVEFVADSLVFAANDESVVNECTASSSVGTAVASDDASIERHNRVYSYKRTDLLCNELDDLQAFADKIVARQANLNRKIESVKLNVHNRNAWPALAVLDHDDPLIVEYQPPSSPVKMTGVCSVRGFTHRVRPHGPESAIEWECDLAMDTGSLTIEDA